jgi:hypothetical protein
MSATNFESIQSRYHASHPCGPFSLDNMPKHPKYLNDANQLRTIKIERRGRKHRVSVLNTKRAVISYKDHASLTAANADALDLIANGSWY